MIEQSLDPKWNEELELRGTFGELCRSLKVALFDKDPIKWSDSLGEVTVELEALRKRSTLKFSKQPLSTQGSVSFTVSWLKDSLASPLQTFFHYAKEDELHVQLEKASGLIEANGSGLRSFLTVSHHFS